jgi:hypothetical protein
MKAGKRNQLRDGLTQQLWGELVGIDNRTDQERTFTVYTLGGSILIVNDKGHERLAGPDNGLNKYEIFREVMAQFQVHSLRVKPPVSDWHPVSFAYGGAVIPLSVRNRLVPGYPVFCHVLCVRLFDYVRLPSTFFASDFQGSLARSPVHRDFWSRRI